MRWIVAIGNQAQETGPSGAKADAMRTIVAMLLVLGAAAVPARADEPVPTKCAVHARSADCSYTATGSGRFVAARAGGWLVRVIRGGVPVWQTGGFTPNQGIVPSRAGDEVLVQTFSLAQCPIPYAPALPCAEGGAVVAVDRRVPGAPI